MFPVKETFIFFKWRAFQHSLFHFRISHDFCRFLNNILKFGHNVDRNHLVTYIIWFRKFFLYCIIYFINTNHMKTCKRTVKKRTTFGAKNYSVALIKKNFVVHLPQKLLEISIWFSKLHFEIFFLYRLFQRFVSQEILIILKNRFNKVFDL